MISSLCCLLIIWLICLPIQEGSLQVDDKALSHPALVSCGKALSCASSASHFKTCVMSAAWHLILHLPENQSSGHQGIFEQLQCSNVQGEASVAQKVQPGVGGTLNGCSSRRICCWERHVPSGELESMCRMCVWVFSSFKWALFKSAGSAWCSLAGDSPNGRQ